MDNMKQHTLRRPPRETPDVYATDDVEIQDKIVYAHYFISGTDIDYYVLEYDREHDEIFCWAELIPDMGELGYSSLRDLEMTVLTIPVNIGNTTYKLPARFELDLYWEKTSLGKVLELREKRSA
jgi:hypothetical protein